MKGLRVSIYRSKSFPGTADRNHAIKFEELTIVGFELCPTMGTPPRGARVPAWSRECEVFEPSEKAPAAVVIGRWVGGEPAFCVRLKTTEGLRTAMGGAYVDSCDSRFRRLAGHYGAVPLHDWVES